VKHAVTNNLTEYTDQTVIAAEGARVGFSICRRCGAAILSDPRETMDAHLRHTQWHQTQQQP
jgi:hypothetical protein